MFVFIIPFKHVPKKIYIHKYFARVTEKLFWNEGFFA